MLLHGSFATILCGQPSSHWPFQSSIVPSQRVNSGLIHPGRFQSRFISQNSTKISWMSEIPAIAKHLQLGYLFAQQYCQNWRCNSVAQVPRPRKLLPLVPLLGFIYLHMFECPRGDGSCSLLSTTTVSDASFVCKEPLHSKNRCFVSSFTIK